MRDEDARQLGRRLAMSQRAADGSALAHADVADLAHRLGEHRGVLGDDDGVLEVDMADQRRQHERPVIELDGALVDAADVDERRGRGVVEHHHGDQALAPGDHVRLVAQLLQLLHRLGPR